MNIVYKDEIKVGYRYIIRDYKILNENKETFIVMICSIMLTCSVFTLGDCSIIMKIHDSTYRIMIVYLTSAYKYFYHNRDENYTIKLIFPSVHIPNCL